MRSTSKSATIKKVLTDADGNKHDAVFTLSVVTRQGGYECRGNLAYPYESIVGEQADAVVKRGNIQVSHFIPYTSTALATELDNFILVAQQLNLISGSVTIPLTDLDIIASVKADFTIMIANIEDYVPPNNSTRVDVDTAYITSVSPETNADTSDQ